AGTNIASVNYHFGGKDALYKKIVEASFDWISLNHQFPDAIEKRGDESEEFDHYIRAFVRQKVLESFGEPFGLPPRLMGWEIVDPKLNIKSMMDHKMEETEEKLIVLLSPLFGADIGAAQKRYAARWFFTFITPPPHLRDGFSNMLGPDASEAELDAAASQLANAAISVVKLLTATPVGLETVSDENIAQP
ncbi:MAG: hypothetical protein JKY99_05820, partial [Rhizobiales bacterium]|nr:hypothetical protein [Hyphomicrobiales bacterium]